MTPSLTSSKVVKKRLMRWGELYYFSNVHNRPLRNEIFLQSKVSQKGRTKNTRLLSIQYITFTKMNVVPRKKTRKKNGYFLLGASFIMFGYWYASIMTNNMNTSLSFVPDVVKEQQTENEEDNSNSLALSQSFGFFDTVSNKEWKLLQKITAEHNNHRFPELPLTYNPVFSKSRRKHFNSNPAWWQENVRRGGS